MENEIPEMECIPVESFDQLVPIVQKMGIMQRTHNMLAKDFETLVDIAKENAENSIRIKPLIRACIKELFSLVEADLYLINQYQPYDGYSNWDKLNEKFKKTYRHHAKNFKKQDLKNQYQSKSYARLYKLKQKRDDIVHPKGLQTIDVTLDDLQEVTEVYNEYRNYVIQLMSNIGFSVELPISFLNGRSTIRS